MTRVPDVSGDLFGDAGAEALASMLRVNGTIGALDVKYNGVGPRGCAAIADALKTTTSLGSLTLWEAIGDEGAEALADALRSHASICDLTLSTRLTAVCALLELCA